METTRQNHIILEIIVFLDIADSWEGAPDTRTDGGHSQHRGYTYNINYKVTALRKNTPFLFEGENDGKFFFSYLNKDLYRDTLKSKFNRSNYPKDL